MVRQYSPELRKHGRIICAVLSTSHGSSRRNVTPGRRRPSRLVRCGTYGCGLLSGLKVCHLHADITSWRFHLGEAVVASVGVDQELGAQIKAAVGAHGMWKARLHSAISTGKSDFEAANVAKDDKCDFGKWLHGGVSGAARSSARYNAVKAEHARFHVEAARVLSLALSGKRDEAKNAMAAGSAFAKISADLTREMMDWKKSVS